MIRSIITILTIVMILGIVGLYTIHVWIEKDVKENIAVVKSMYPGNAEEALLSFLLDDSNPTIERTHIAIWTLGQIGSKKALPVLKEYYQNDPNGETCIGKHHELLCQYEINKAIEAIDGHRLFKHARLIK